MSHHDHGGDDPFLGEEGAAFMTAWTTILETGTAAVSKALLDAARVGPGTRTLDLACGLGPTAVAAARRGAIVTGLDLNTHMLAEAHQAPGITYIEGDMTAPPTGPWDAIVSRFGAHHADPAWLQAAVKNLAPGGTVAIAEWALDTALFDVEGAFEAPAEDAAEDWVARFEAAGLRDITTNEVSFTIDFGDEATFLQFLSAMHEGTASRTGAPGGKQVNKAYIVAGRR